jgi:hypothetical protein
MVAARRPRTLGVGSILLFKGEFRRNEDIPLIVLPTGRIMRVIQASAWGIAQVSA